MSSTVSPRVRQGGSLLLGIVIVAVLIWYSGYESFLDTLSRASLSLLGLSLLVYILSWPVHVLRMHVCLRTLEHRAGIWKLFEINIAGYGLNIVLPAKLGDVARVIYLTQEQIPVGTAVATVAYVRLADLASVAVLVLVTISVLDASVVPVWVDQILLGIVFVGILVVGLLFLNRYASESELATRGTAWLSSRLESRLFHGALDAGRQASRDFDSLVFGPRTVVSTAVTSVLIWLIEALTAVAVAWALGVNIPILLLLFAVSVANLAKILPLTPGGLGIYEAAFTAILSVFAIPVSVSLAIAIIEHNLKNLFLIIVGTPIATKLGTETVLHYQAE